MAGAVATTRTPINIRNPTTTIVERIGGHGGRRRRWVHSFEHLALQIDGEECVAAHGRRGRWRKERVGGRPAPEEVALAGGLLQLVEAFVLVHLALEERQMVERRGADGALGGGRGVRRGSGGSGGSGGSRGSGSSGGSGGS